MVTGSGEIAVWTETALAQETHLGDRKLRVFFFSPLNFLDPLRLYTSWAAPWDQQCGPGRSRFDMTL